MRRFAVFLVSLFLVAFATSPAAAAPGPRLIEATVVRVADGDTLTAQTKDGAKLKVRLLGIDAPELERLNKKTGQVSKPGQPYGAEAKAFLERLVLGKAVRVETHGTDLYGRQVAVVMVGSSDVNVELVRAGLAELYRGRNLTVFYETVLYAFQEEAKQAGRGMWSLGERYESPRAFRARHRIRGE
jgi:endonuclease YncB( thermonuclease family)